MEGWVNAVSYASLGWLILMGALYIIGALLYAGRIPERYFPGKCDIWVRFQYSFLNIEFQMLKFAVKRKWSNSFVIDICSLVSKSSDIPRAGNCGRIRPLSRHFRNGSLPVDQQPMPGHIRRRLNLEHHHGKHLNRKFAILQSHPHTSKFSNPSVQKIYFHLLSPLFSKW